MPSTIDKTRRQQAILSVLGSQEIGSQDELAEALEDIDISVTQATLSRDLRDLGVARVPVDDGYRYLTPESGRPEASKGLGPERLRVITSLEVTDIEANEAVVAIRTIQGRAEGVAAFLDTADVPGILATIAGDDTLIVYPRRTRDTAKLRRRLAEMFGTH